MRQIKIFRGKDGTEVRLFKNSTEFIIWLRGPKPEPRVYRDSDGKVYGIKRLPALVSSTPITLTATNSSDAHYQAKTMLKAVRMHRNSQSHLCHRRRCTIVLQGRHLPSLAEGKAG
jgi:hypothetical protein